MISTILIAIGYLVCIFLLYSSQKELDAAHSLIKTLMSSIQELDDSNIKAQLLISNLESQNNLLEESLAILEQELKDTDEDYTTEYNLLKADVLKSIQQLQASQELLIQKINDKNII